MQNNEQRTETLTRQIPALTKIPYEQRLIVFNQAFRSTSYKIFLAFLFIAFILVFYFNLDAVLAYKGLERNGLFARSVHLFLKRIRNSLFSSINGGSVYIGFGKKLFCKTGSEKVRGKTKQIIR